MRHCEKAVTFHGIFIGSYAALNCLSGGGVWDTCEAGSGQPRVSEPAEVAVCGRVPSAASVCATVKPAISSNSIHHQSSLYTNISKSLCLYCIY